MRFYDKLNSLFTLSTSMTNGKRELKRRVRLIGDRPKVLWLAAALVVLFSGIAGLAACSEGALPTEEEAALYASTPKPAALPTDNDAIRLLDSFSDRVEAGDEVRSALYAYFRAYRSESERSFDDLLERGYLINIYAVRAFQGGTLALADFAYEGEMFPDLFYIENEAVISRTYGTDPWSISYTRLLGSTVAYGKSFAWDNGILASTHAEATFLSGAADTASMPASAGNEDTTTGFILVADSDTWLSSLEIYNDDALITDDHNEQFEYNEVTRSSIFGRTWFRPMYTPQTFALCNENFGKVKLTVNGEEQSLLPLYKETGALLADTWRSNEHRMNPAIVMANAPISMQGLSEKEIIHVYWADISLDDGTDESMARCLSEPLGLADSLNRDDELGYIWSTPGKSGQYVFIIETADAFYAQGVIVEK